MGFGIQIYNKKSKLDGLKSLGAKDEYGKTGSSLLFLVSPNNVFFFNSFQRAKGKQLRGACYSGWLVLVSSPSLSMEHITFDFECENELFDFKN